jgi:uncharacterized protein
MKDNIIGIISDTHDNRTTIKKAVDVFNEKECSLVLHAGDFIAPFTYLDFKNLKCGLIGVFGNNDGEKKGLSEKFSILGGIFEPPYELNYNGKNFVLMHEPYFIEEYIARGTADVIIYGHIHETDIRYGNPLIINPGECCGYLTGKCTVAVLDISEMGLELIDL